MDKAMTEKFIASWGRMGTMWGISASVARVHALLIASEEPLSLEEIATWLKISRGNASMSLRELRNWTIVRLVKKPGDRQDYYETESDIWKMFIAITKERKRREFEPMLAVVRDTLSHLQKGSNNETKARLRQMDELLTTLNAIAERFLADEASARAIISFVSRFSKKR